jgi:hypothetical protein
VFKAFVTEADYQNRTIASWLVPLLPGTFPRLKKLWADGGYTGTWLDQLPDGLPIDRATHAGSAPQRDENEVNWWYSRYVICLFSRGAAFSRVLAQNKAVTQAGFSAVA